MLPCCRAHNMFECGQSGRSTSGWPHQESKPSKAGTGPVFLSVLSGLRCSVSLSLNAHCLYLRGIKARSSEHGDWPCSSEVLASACAIRAVWWNVPRQAGRSHQPGLQPALLGHDRGGRALSLGSSCCRAHTMFKSGQSGASTSGWPNQVTKPSKAGAGPVFLSVWSSLSFFEVAGPRVSLIRAVLRNVPSIVKLLDHTLLVAKHSTCRCCRNLRFWETSLTGGVTAFAVHVEVPELAPCLTAVKVKRARADGQSS